MDTSTMYRGLEMNFNRGGVASTSVCQFTLSPRHCRPLAGQAQLKRRTPSAFSTAAEISKESQAAVRKWRQYYRYLQYQKAAHLPRVSWDRYHLSVIFVDRTDTVRAKVAAGLFDRIANWNGFGRALYPTTAGVSATGQAVGLATSAGLMSQAGLLKIPPKLFSRPGEQFEAEDLDRNDIVLASDSETLKRLKEIACEGVQDCSKTMAQVALLADFATYIGPTALRRTGGTALLEPELRQIVEPGLPAAARGGVDIASPALGGGAEEWNAMVRSTVCGAAGLVQFLIDAWPPDLPDYDPL